MMDRRSFLASLLAPFFRKFLPKPEGLQVKLVIANQAAFRAAFFNHPYINPYESPGGHSMLMELSGLYARGVQS